MTTAAIQSIISDVPDIQAKIAEHQEEIGRIHKAIQDETDRQAVWDLVEVKSWSLFQSFIMARRCEIERLKGKIDALSELIGEPTGIYQYEEETVELDPGDRQNAFRND